MKTVFILNPMAGTRKKEKFLHSVKKAKDEFGDDVEIYTTKMVGDAREYVSEYCQNTPDARFIACGGDGTVNEVVNGIVLFPEASLGVFPLGTGNDFLRNFDGCTFFDACRQINADTVLCDSIRCTLHSAEGKSEIRCVNMVNIGFDCNVVVLSRKFSLKRFIPGPVSYLMSVFINLVKKKGANLKIELDGKVCHEGKLLLTSIANGSFCGGGFMSNPNASVTDGFIDINIIRDVSRCRFVSLLASYRKGTFLQKRGIGKIVSSEKCKRISVTAEEGRVKICVDGEIYEVTRADFEILPASFKLALPR